MRVRDVKVGYLKDPISIQKAFLGQKDGGGGQVTTWPEVCHPWAWVMPFRGSKSQFAGQNRATITHSIVIIYMVEPLILPDMKVILVSQESLTTTRLREFNIKSVIDIEEAHEYWELQCVEGEPG